MSSAPFSSLPADAQRVGMSGRRFPRFVQLPGDNHTAIVAHIDSVKTCSVPRCWRLRSPRTESKAHAARNRPGFRMVR